MAMEGSLDSCPSSSLPSDLEEDGVAPEGAGGAVGDPGAGAPPVWWARPSQPVLRRRWCRNCTRGYQGAVCGYCGELVGGPCCDGGP